jgi:CMP-N-acetylneuraminic acid synthetase
MIGKKRVLGITLARGGSKTIRKKNIISVCGKPLLHYTVVEAHKSSFIDTYVVSSDDEEILNIAKALGALTHKRSCETSTDTATSASALKEVLSDYSGYDVVVELMCTNPLKIVDDIDGCINIFEKNDAKSAVSVMQIFDHHPSRVKYIVDNRLIDFFPEIPESRRQDLSPPAFVRNGSIYVFRPQNVLLYDCRLIEPYAYVMPTERCVNIDEQRDLIYAEQMVRNR